MLLSSVADCFIYLDDVASWTTGDITTGTQRAVDDAVEFKSTQLVYDNIGNGASVKTYATLTGEVSGLTFTGFGGADTPDFADDFYDDPKDVKSESDHDLTNRGMFRNKRAQYYKLLADRFYRTYLAVVKGAYFDPETLVSVNGSMDELKQLRSELIKIRRKRTPGMKLYQIESKQEMMKRGVKSPNLADSVMMSWGSAEESSYKYERRAVRARR